MIIENLALQNFKNYENIEFEFCPEVNIITGLNGSGKTNLVEALNYISLTKGAFQTQDALNIRNGSTFFSIKCIINVHQETYIVVCSFISGQKKSIIVNRKPIQKFTDHIGQFPLVLISPFDTDLIRGGSEERRRFFDAVISQVDHTYLINLIHYTAFLKQRNALLKSSSYANNIDLTLLEYYDHQLINLSKVLFIARQNFLDEFLLLFLKFYAALWNYNELVSLNYTSHLSDENFEQSFANARHKDIMLQRTTRGIHRDDFIFSINNNPIKQFGSQGQQKSFVIALKLAQFEIIKNKKGFAPVLILDDIFDKLDYERTSNFLQLISSSNFGQLFITDSRIDRVMHHIPDIIKSHHIIKIKGGAKVYE